jgi:pimeloyl-ACP methyl ester carboxylesterase
MRTLAALLLLAAPALADGPKDNVPDNVRPIPPKGTPLEPAVKDELQLGLLELKAAIVALENDLKGKRALLELLPDVEVYHKAVRYAVEFDEMYSDKKRDDVKGARDLLKVGMQRAKELRDGKPSWTTATGLVVRGYRSKIDGSVQPYGLVVPASYGRPPWEVRARNPLYGDQYRLDFWWHGRGETLTELEFIRQRQTSRGEFAPDEVFVLHPYGRYCNANKFAGEIDTFECLEHARRHYPIHLDAVVARGFSMGGASCWQFAVHYPDVWAAAAPGAGFAETPEFLNVFQNEKIEPAWWERKLWRLYNATDYAGNLYHVPTVAYSGQNDRQKQAADVMARELKKVGIDLLHVIGPNTGHSYHPDSKSEINERVDRVANSYRNPVPGQIKFTTWSLRYNRCFWLRINGLESHWNKAEVAGEQNYYKGVKLTTRNVSGLTIEFPISRYTEIDLYAKMEIDLDNQKLPPVLPKSDRTWVLHARKVNGKWQSVTSPFSEGLAKKPSLQGPIDDAFMDRFLNVRPTGTPLHEKPGAWAAKEMAHAVDHWRKQFRGDAPVKDDQAVTDDDIKNANLVLWGDPSSNAVLARIADKLPVKWTKDGVVLGDKTYDAATHVPVLIFPNPLNSTKYVVLNSGFTFREYDHLNNARQVPKLPDYAILDVTTPPNSRYPGKVVRAGFFGEKWELLANDGQ